MKISYAVTAFNEIDEIQKLIPQLLEFKRSQDEVVVLYDNNGTKEVFDYLQSIKGIKLVWDNFNGHFADWKNKLNFLCSGDFIFQIDADELLSEEMFESLPLILESNPEVDLYYVPRINTVSGHTQEHIQRWGWRVENGKVNYPDYQTRIYRNVPYIKWKNKVHEVIEGHKQYTALPAVDELSLIHPKTIEKQEKQNDYYNTL
jgi:hypothetical protein